MITSFLDIPFEGLSAEDEHLIMMLHASLASCCSSWYEPAGTVWEFYDLELGRVSNCKLFKDFLKFYYHSCRLIFALNASLVVLSLSTKFFLEQSGFFKMSMQVDKLQCINHD